ncbi:hypothetical protein CIB95_10995 [Lottiidibacillus patelloidae]|uniref:Uncharacterized protein n=1 Tax=Lottiidibacillus patelloidae TaxID=2670334 RepID=A0A263BSR9_9BACI|nr:hypothetical protein [Lottiidibacillus patelloidae]OZM56739.1 hypothetical protein CIB95_10995 [Lottiidibacillus patelloidae]
MDKMLKDLDKVMDEAVYQRKRFNDKQKQDILQKINMKNERKNSSFRYRLHQALSIAAVCILFVSVFSLVYIEKKSTTKKNEEKIELQGFQEPVASIALIKRIEELLVRENIIYKAEYHKVDHHINLIITVSNELSSKQITEVAEQFLKRGSIIYENLPSAAVFDGVVDVWESYSLTIEMKTLPSWNVNYGSGNQLLNTNEKIVLKGSKEKKSKEIDWSLIDN